MSGPGMDERLGACDACLARTWLLARLAGFTVLLPPLRERRADLGALIAALPRRHAPGRAPTFTHAAAPAPAIVSAPAFATKNRAWMRLRNSLCACAIFPTCLFLPIHP